MEYFSYYAFPLPWTQELFYFCILRLLLSRKNCVMALFLPFLEHFAANIKERLLFCFWNIWTIFMCWNIMELIVRVSGMLLAFHSPGQLSFRWKNVLMFLDMLKYIHLYPVLFINVLSAASPPLRRSNNFKATQAIPSSFF